VTFFLERPEKSWQTLLDYFNSDTQKDRVKKLIASYIPSHEDVLRLLIDAPDLNAPDLNENAGLLEQMPKQNLIVSSTQLPFVRWDKNSCGLDSTYILVAKLLSLRPNLLSDIPNFIKDKIDCVIEGGMKALGPSWETWLTERMTKNRDALRLQLSKGGRDNGNRIIVDYDTTTTDVLYSILPRALWTFNVRPKYRCVKKGCVTGDFTGSSNHVDTYLTDGLYSGKTTIQRLLDVLVRRPLLLCSHIS
jgi:hypothetical protein